MGRVVWSAVAALVCAVACVGSAVGAVATGEDVLLAEPFGLAAVAFAVLSLRDR